MSESPNAPACAPVQVQAEPQPARPQAPRPVRRVGTLTMGIALVIVGVALCAGLLFPNFDFLFLLRLAPLVLVALGCEVIFAAAHAKEARLKYDFLSMLVCFALILASLFAACVPVVVQYAGPQRSAAERAVQQDLYDATYAQLKGSDTVVDVTYSVSLSGLRDLTAVRSAQDLTANDFVRAFVTLQGEWTTPQDFAAACKPVIDAIYATGVHSADISISMQDPQDVQLPKYALELSGRYQADMAAQQLARFVSQSVYVEDAWYYMSDAALAEWRITQDEIAQDAAQSEQEAQWQERLDEAERYIAQLEEALSQAQADAAA